MIEHTAPIILDLGKKKKRALRALQVGRGRLIEEVEQAIEQVRTGLGEEGEGKQLVPIVLIYKSKRKRRPGRLW
jgi:hypothetical protein